jgi:hypothetical protein
MGPSTRLRYCAAGIVILFGVAMASRPAGAQESLERHLTGGSSRAWVLQRFIRSAEPGDACTSGEIYTFAAIHDLTVSRCEGGHIVQSHHAWSLSETGGRDTILTIGGMGTFLLLCRDPGPGIHLMRLHSTSTAQVQPSIDKEFSFDED